MSCYFKHSKRIYVVQNMPQTTIMMEILFTQRQIFANFAQTTAWKHEYWTICKGSICIIFITIILSNAGFHLFQTHSLPVYLPHNLFVLFLLLVSLTSNTSPLLDEGWNNNSAQSWVQRGFLGRKHFWGIFHVKKCKFKCKKKNHLGKNHNNKTDKFLKTATC